MILHLCSDTDFSPQTLISNSCILVTFDIANVDCAIYQSSKFYIKGAWWIYYIGLKNVVWEEKLGVGAFVWNIVEILKAWSLYPVCALLKEMSFCHKL